MTEPANGAHLADDAHIRFLDGECEADERMAVTEHVARCSRCARRLAELRERSAAVTRLLADVDAAPREALARARPPRRVRLLVAAAGLVLVVAAAAVSPVRAWIVGRSQALWTLVSGGLEQPAPAPSPIRTEQATPFASVSFAVERDRLIVDMARRQAEGVLVVEIVDAVTASAAITGGELGGDLLVLPGRLRIVNAPESTASYRVRVPATLTRVEVLVAGEREAVLDPRRTTESRTVDLGAPPGR
jgi:hypothetical protein